MALPTIDFVAPSIRAALASLQADFPAQVALFNAEAANTVDIEAPQTYKFGIVEPHAAFPFPQVEVAAVEGSFGQWALERVEVDHDPRVNVVIWLQGVTGETDKEYERALGMIRCAIEILSRPDAFGPEVEISNEQGIYWRLSELIPLEMDDVEREVRKWLVPAFLQFRLEKVEHFT